MEKHRQVYIGVGHPFLRDDRAGGLVIKALETLFSEETVKPLLLDTAGSPENFLGPIMRVQPDHVFLIDAVDMAMPPGSVISMEWSKEIHLDAQPFSLPLDKFCQFVATECACPITILGIQAQRIGYGTEVSEPVLDAIRELSVHLYTEWLNNNPAGE